MVGPNVTEPKPHDEVQELLPWYATGELDESDRARVDAHLNSCAFCRQQLALERRLIGEFQEMAPEVESGWARLRGRIETPAPVWPRRPSLLGQFWEVVSRPMVAGLAVAQLTFLIVAGGVLLSLSRPDYHGLSSAPAPASANVIIIFRADATEEDVRGALRAAGASIVGGPTDANAYLLHVAPSREQVALTRLRSDDNVQMAEPIDGVGS